MTWAHPAALWALIAVLVLAIVAVRATRTHHARLAAVFRGGFDRTILPGRVRVRRSVARACAVGALTCLVVALAEPRAGSSEQDIEAEGVDLVLAVDLSRSMDARDVDPSRLERARREILDLTERMQGDRVGLVIYAGGAYPRMPLTLDYKALKLLVRELDTHVFQAQGSNLAEAIREGIGLLGVSEATAGKAIVVLTDGEVHRPEAAYEAADEAAAAGVAVYGWIIGQQAAPIPDPSRRGGGEFVIDPRTQQTAMTTPDPTTLEEVARRTGGAVVRSVPGTSDVEALYDREIRGTLRATVGQRGVRQVQDSAVGLPLTLAALLGLLAAWLGDGRAGRGLWLVLCLLGAVVPRAAHAADPQALRDADLAYQAGRTEEALRNYEAMVAESPDDPALLQRLGAARYRIGDARGAADAFDRAARSGGADAAYNAGNAWWQAGLLERAQARYREALARDPEHAAAKDNLQRVEQAIEVRRAEAPPPPPPQEASQPQQDGSPSPNDEDDADQPPGGQGAPENRDESSDASQRQGADQRPPEDGPQEGSGTDQSADPDQPPGEGPPPQGEASPDGSGEPPPPSDDPASGQSGPQGGEPPEGDGTRQDDAQGSEPADLDDITDAAGGQGGEDTAAGDPEGEGTGGSGGSPTDGAAGEDASKAQAERILDGVEEGRPRVYVPGRGGELPW